MTEYHSQQAYLDHQQAVFDEMSDFFGSNEATPPDVVPAMRHLSNAILKQQENKPTVKLMDVGCGTGALFPFYLDAAKALNISSLQITGVDLSPKMATLARQRAENLLKEGTKNLITIVDSNFVSLMDTEKEYQGAYNVVVANACFGNFFDIGESYHSSAAVHSCACLYTSHQHITLFVCRRCFGGNGVVYKGWRNDLYYASTRGRLCPKAARGGSQHSSTLVAYTRRA
jgi:SAM-dependent methyltransferase